MIELLSPQGALAGSLRSYEDRPEQRRMAAAVEAALEDARPLLVEAGTGTGKTLAYLLPAAVSGRKVVISTGSRPLQEQIANHDLPLLARVLGRPVRAAVLKGVSNYVCRRRYQQLIGARVRGVTDSWELEELMEWITGTESGDRSEVAGISERDAIWEWVTTSPEGRLGGRCPEYDRCFVTHARRRAEQADLIIVNHHLFFADLALRALSPGGKVLPAYDAVVFDEAHQLDGVISDHFGVKVSTSGFAAIARDAAATLRSAEGERLRQHLETCGGTFFRRVRQLLGGHASEEAPRVPLEPGALEAEAEEEWFRLDTGLEQLEAHAALRAGGGEDDRSGEEAAALADRCARLRDALADIVTDRSGAQAYWAEFSGPRTTLRGSLIDTSGVLRDELFRRTRAVVFASATLATGGDFSFTRAQLGLPREAADAIEVESPFDYAEQALLYLPRDLPDPREGGFADAFAKRIAELVPLQIGGAFVLCTSRRAVQQVASRLPSLTDRLLLTQGTAPRSALLDRFRRDGQAILVGTGSFWEGIDIPGPALSLVVIDKLPFSPPDDPLTAARLRSLEENELDPFASYQLPQAALALKQGVGRLIRRRDDRGVIAIMDRRVVTRAYGSVFVDSLPRQLPRTSSLEQVRRWCQT